MAIISCEYFETILKDDTQEIIIREYFVERAAEEQSAEQGSNNI